MQSIYIKAETLPEAWEQATLECWKKGSRFPTQYDKPDDPNSRDITALIHIKNPIREPRIHRAFPGGLEDLESYRAEVLYGCHDYWMDDINNEHRWKYTYYQRLFEYELPADPHPWPLVNQIDTCIKMLKECGYTRRAQAVTWKCWEDLQLSDPPCLQRLYFRVEKQICDLCYGSGEKDMSPCWKCKGTGQTEKLNMNVHMRSNDLYKANYMNCYAFIELQAWIAEQIGVECGEYIHVADSLHIYGSYFDEFEGFLKTVQNRKFEDRVWRSDDKDVVIPSFIEGCDRLLSEPKMPQSKKDLIQTRKQHLQNLL